MGVWGFRCPSCGLPNLSDGPGEDVCDLCGTQCAAEKCGYWRDDDPGVHFPNVIGDELHGKRAQFDWAAGQAFKSKAERRRVLKAKGLGEMSFRDAQKEGLVGDHPSPTKTYSYEGQRNRDTTRHWR